MLTVRYKFIATLRNNNKGSEFAGESVKGKIECLLFTFHLFFAAYIPFWRNKGTFNPYIFITNISTFLFP